MRNPHRSLSAARQSGGFTLVELLVVIGIIAILAGVALGPITNGIKKAKESGAMQTCRTLALAEFQFANDNNGCYPDSSAASAGDVCSGLCSGSYVTDPSLFGVSGDANFVKQTTIPLSTATWSTTNCSYDFMGVTAGTGVTSSAPDQLPLVWTPDPAAKIPTKGGEEFAPTTGLFAKDGIAVAYHSNNAYFRAPVGNKPAAGAYPDTKGDLLFADQTFDPGSITYQIDKGASGY